MGETIEIGNSERALSHKLKTHYIVDDFVSSGETLLSILSHIKTIYPTTPTIKGVIIGNTNVPTVTITEVAKQANVKISNLYNLSL
jgi:orotate phosphoribosyltransferase-like protein